MRARTARLLAAVVVSVIALGACDTNVGTAGRVGGDRISESDVNQYLTPASAPFQNGQGNQVVPRSFVLQTLIRDRLFTRALVADNALPSPGEITSRTTQLLNGQTEASLTEQITKSGFAARFEPVYVRSEVLLQAYAEHVKATTAAQVSTALAKLNIPVTTSPRYGPWDPAPLAVGPQQPPDFLTLGSASAAPTGR